MADYVRRLVSGPKARTFDPELKLELDLVYVTPRIIIMGYPASGLESFYRNKRADAKRWLDTKHGKSYWVFNFCPIRENYYEGAVFEGRVTRFPFPDHHAPPLALMPLVAREVKGWLDSDPKNVAVFHCKAGKGRSGTMACSYLLSVSNPTPALSSSSQKEKNAQAEALTNSAIDQIPSSDPEMTSGVASPELGYNDDPGLPYPPGSPPLLIGHPSPSEPATNPERSFVDALKGVLDLHTATRMKPSTPTPKSSTSSSTPADLDASKKMPGALPATPSSEGVGKVTKQRQGVSIPSQRRWLYYWALILGGGAPADIFSSNVAHTPKTFVRITQIRIQMREPGGVKQGLVKAANVVIDKAVALRRKKNASSPKAKTEDDAEDSQSDSDASESESKTPSSTKANTAPFTSGSNKLWASIARYDDRLVEFLDRWEAHTRQPKKESAEENLREIADELSDFRFGEEGKWDREKMVRNFARFGLVGEAIEAGKADVPEPNERDASGAREEKRGNGKEGDEKKVWEYRLGLVSDKRLKSRPTENASEATWTQEVTPNVKIEGVGEQGEKDADASSIASSAVASSVGLGKAKRRNASKNQEQGLVVEASRELRVKLYVGKVFIGWLWFIPSFHMNQRSTGPSPEALDAKHRATFHLTRKDLDFPLGLGSSLVDVDIDMQWVPSDHVPLEGDGEVLAGSASPNSLDVAAGEASTTGGAEGTGGYGATKVAQALNAAMQGDGREALKAVVETGQASEA